MRPLSSRTRWKFCGPSPGVHPGPHRGVRVHPLGGRRPRQQLQEHLEVGDHVGTSFSMPMTVIRVSGRVRHIRPLPSDSTTAIVPVSATAKFAPQIADPRGEELPAQVCPRGHRERPRLVGEVRVDARHLAQEDLADLGAVAVDGGHEDVRRLVVAELDDQLGEVGLDRRDPASLECLVEARLLRGHRLDLDDLVGAGGPHQVRDDPVRLLRRRAPSARRRRGRSRLLELHEQLRQARHHVGLDAARPRRRSSSQSSTSRDDGGALGADGAGGVRRGCGAAGCRRATGAPRRGTTRSRAGDRPGPTRRSACRGSWSCGDLLICAVRRQDLGEVHGAHARCAAGTARRRCA